jgi:protein tyrosine phosphatase (PTP) superfamily phosphohydrolase (DUF442 family)
VNVLNFVPISERLASSGQPAAEDFPAIAAEGFGTVINLAMPTSDNAIAEEGAIVTGLGMNYIHIPVVWEAPRVAQFHAFCRILQQLEDTKTWVHCALNMRVSCFLYLYHTEVAGMPEPEARALMHRIWNPDDFPAWKRFIEDVRSNPQPLLPGR